MVLGRVFLEYQYKKKSRYKKLFAADEQMSYIEIRLYLDCATVYM